MITQEQILDIADWLTLHRKEIVTPKEAAKILQIDQVQLYLLTHYNAIPHFKPMPSTHYFHKGSLKQWKRTCKDEWERAKANSIPKDIPT